MSRKGFVFLAIVSVGIAISAHLPAHLTGNLGMLFLERLVFEAGYNPILYANAASLIDTSLQLDPTMSRLPEVRRWLRDARVRATRVQQHRALRAKIETATEEQQLQALISESDDIEVWLRLAHDYERHGDNAALQQVLARLSARPPEDPIANTFTLGDWRLEGYDWLSLSTGLFQQVRIVLHWRSNDHSATSLSPETGIYQWDDRMLQVVVEPNLIPSGDMESLSFEGIRPLPLPWWLLSPDAGLEPVKGYLTPDHRGPGSVLRVTNLSSETAFFYYPKIQPGHTYLLVGQVWAMGDGVYAVMENVNGVNQWPIVIRYPKDDEWRSYAGVFVPQAREYSRVYFGLYDPSATAEYDNLGVFEIKLPPG